MQFLTDQTSRAPDITKKPLPKLLQPKYRGVLIGSGLAMFAVLIASVSKILFVICLVAAGIIWCRCILVPYEEPDDRNERCDSRTLWESIIFCHWEEQREALGLRMNHRADIDQFPGIISELAKLQESQHSDMKQIIHDTLEPLAFAAKEVEEINRKFGLHSLV